MKPLALIGGSILLIVLAAFLPAKYEHVVRMGTDKFEAHHPLFGPRIKSDTEVAQAPVGGVGLVLVNLRRAQVLAPAHIRITSPVKGEIIQKDVAVASDDGFAWIPIPSGAIEAGDTYTIEVSSPQSPMSAPVGVRFDQETKQFALALQDRVVVWQYIVRWSEQYPELAYRFFVTLVGGIILAGILLVLEYVPSRLQRYVWIGSLLVLAGCTIAIRIPLAHVLESAYGGDAFNYLLKSRALIDGQDPFAADPRKAPLYSLLVAPGLATPFDAATWERYVSIAAAAGTVIVVPLLLRRYGLPRSFALAGGALLAFNRDFQFESVQGLANTLYTFLIVLSAYLFSIGRTYVLAVTSALAALTRYEGIVVAGILVPPSWILERLRYTKILRTLLPLGILLAIPFLLSPFSHTLGVRTLSDIQGDEGLYLAHSFDDFASNFIGFKHFVGMLWILTPHIGKPFAALGIGIVLGGIGVMMRNVKYTSSAWGIPYGAALGILFLVVRGLSEESAYLIELFSVLAGIGIVYGIEKAPARTLSLVGMLVVHIVLITAILPKSRYYLPIIPFIAVAMVLGVYSFTKGAFLKTRIGGGILVLSLIASLVYADARQALPGQVSDYNEKSAGQTVLLNAARLVKREEGIVGVAEGSDLQLRTYLPGERVAILPDSVRDIDDQYNLLRSHQVTWIVNTTENPYFTALLEQMPEKFQAVESFTTRWSDVTSHVYRVY